MAHNITRITLADGSSKDVYAESLAGGQRRAWHGLGETTEGAMTVADAMRLSSVGNLEWVESPLSTTILGDDGVSTLEVGSHKAITMRNKSTGLLTPVAVVGKDRKTFQPHELLEPLDALAGDAGTGIQTFGVLSGRMAFATVKFPKDFTIGGDKYEGYILGHDSMDGTSAFTIRPTLVRVVCNNTLDSALGMSAGVAKYVLRHTKFATTPDIQKVRDAIGMVPAMVESFEPVAAQLLQREMNWGDFTKFSARLFGADPGETSKKGHTLFLNREDSLARLWRAETQASTFRHGSGTAMTAFQTVAEYACHVQSVRGGKGNEAAARTKRLVGGDVGKIEDRALALLLS